MNANSFGSRFVINTFGESHGVALGVVIDGCPAGLDFDLEFLTKEMERRRPGVYSQEQIVVSARKELDSPEILSGVFEGKTLGTPIAILVRNQDQRSEDYEKTKDAPRIGHADDVWKCKFGHADYRGGGRSSGRETLCRVLGGAVAKMLIRKISPATIIEGYVSQVGNHKLASAIELQSIKEVLSDAQKKGESLGGEVTIRIQKPIPNLGQPVFHKLKSDLAAAMMSVGAATGFEIGAGFDVIEQAGTAFHKNKNAEVYGGIRGGISTGEDIVLRIAMKPTSSILDVAKQGRHDPCIAIRAVPVFESMAALVIADHLLWMKQDRA